MTYFLFLTDIFSMLLIMDIKGNIPIMFLE